MAKKKLRDEDVKVILEEYDKGFGETPANLSKKWGVHPTTIRRYLREGGASSPRQSHRLLITDRDKVLLRKILLDFRVSNPNKLIGELDRHFELKERKMDDEDFITIRLD